MVLRSIIRSPLAPIVSSGVTGSFPLPTQSETTTLVAAFSTPPSAARQIQINTLIYALKAAGLWTKLDVLQIFAAADSQAASLNWKNPATFTAAGVSSPTFTADQGHNGDGAASYVNTTWAPTNGVNYTQDSATIFGWSRTAASDSDGWVGTGTASNVFIIPRSAGNSLFYRINQTAATATVAGATDGSGLWAASRSAAAAVQAYRNGATFGAAGSTASAALSANQINIGRANSAFNPAQCAAWGAGANLSDTEHAALYAALRTYMADIGAA